MNPTESSFESEASSRALPERLRNRLKRAITQNRSPSSLPPVPESPPRTRASACLATREPSEVGRLLVWRERFEEPDWNDGDGPGLFGASMRPSVLREHFEHGGLDPKRLAFVDIETCGLADLPVFLVGILYARDGGWTLAQILAPDPSAEPEMLTRSADLLSRYGDWVSFNGRSFDMPRLKRRCRLHDIEWPACSSHRDLLHDVRRRWKDDLPDCKLSTVESRLLGLERLPGDVPGRDVPERYYDFVHTGQRRWIDPVVEHNRRDVAALAVLLSRLVGD